MLPSLVAALEGLPGSCPPSTTWLTSLPWMATSSVPISWTWAATGAVGCGGGGRYRRARSARRVLARRRRQRQGVAGPPDRCPEHHRRQPGSVGEVPTSHAVDGGLARLRPRRRRARPRDGAVLDAARCWRCSPATKRCSRTRQRASTPMASTSSSTARLFLNDPDGLDPARLRARCTCPALLGGRTRIDGELDLEDSVEFLAELETIYDELWRADQAAADADPLKDRSPRRAQCRRVFQMLVSSAAGDRDPPDGDAVTGTLRLMAVLAPAMRTRSPGADAPDAALGGRSRSPWPISRPSRAISPASACSRTASPCPGDPPAVALRLGHRSRDHGGGIGADRPRAHHLHHLSRSAQRPIARDRGCSFRAASASPAGARRTTSCRSRTVRPTSRTWSCCANAITSRSPADHRADVVPSGRAMVVTRPTARASRNDHHRDPAGALAGLVQETS